MLFFYVWFFFRELVRFSFGEVMWLDEIVIGYIYRIFWYRADVYEIFEIMNIIRGKER